MKEIKFKQIGLIHSPYKRVKGTPIQPTGAKDVEGKVELFSEYSEGLKDLEYFSHIILIYQFHLSKGGGLLVKPYMDNNFRGVFATRAPRRPNPIGISIVRLDKIVDNILYIRDIDIIDGTPLLDIKPYVPKFDMRNVKSIGWLEDNVHKLSDVKDDERFIK